MMTKDTLDALIAEKEKELALYRKNYYHTRSYHQEQAIESAERCLADLRRMRKKAKKERHMDLDESYHVPTLEEILKSFMP